MKDSKIIIQTAASCCPLVTLERSPLTYMKAWWSTCIDLISIDTTWFLIIFSLVEEGCSLLLTESLSLEGFSINQVQCFTESALRTPSWRSSWESCPPGCLCVMRGGTLHWEHWSADSWVIWGWHTWLGHTTLQQLLTLHVCLIFICLSRPSLRYIGLCSLVS